MIIPFNPTLLEESFFGFLLTRCDNLSLLKGFKGKLLFRNVQFKNLALSIMHVLNSVFDRLHLEKTTSLGKEISLKIKRAGSFSPLTFVFFFSLISQKSVRYCLENITELNLKGLLPSIIMFSKSSSSENSVFPKTAASSSFFSL